MKKIDINFFPGYTRKAISYTIDDGNIPTDIKFLDIVKPLGFKGAFNLCGASMNGYTHDDYRRIYEGCEITNHCATHPMVMPDDMSGFTVSDEYYDEEKAEDTVFFKSPTEDGVYMKSRKARGVSPSRHVSPERYVELIKKAQAELESVFGEGSVVQFVWPFGKQDSRFVLDYLKDNFYAVRQSGAVDDKTGFAIPQDKIDWKVSATYNLVHTVGDKFDAYEDDGELKLFTFGYHSADFERTGTWGNLEYMAKKLGGRPNDFWYATNREVFEYSDAVKALEVTDTEIYNPSKITLYVKIDGNPTVVPAGSKISI